MFHTTQLVLPTTSSFSPGRRSECSARVLRCSRTTPPWLCTMPFGHARGARGEEHPQRVVERQRVGRPRRARPPATSSQVWRRASRGRHVDRTVDPDDVPQGRQLGEDLGQHVAAVDVPTAVPVAGRGDQDDGLELLEPGDDRAGPELRGDDRPHRAHRRGGEQPDDRLDPVGQHGDHPVAGPHPALAQERRQGADLPAQLAPGWSSVGCRPRRARRRPRPSSGQRPRGVVDRRPGEPAAAGHGIRRHRPVARACPPRRRSSRPRDRQNPSRSRIDQRHSAR